MHGALKVTHKNYSLGPLGTYLDVCVRSRAMPPGARMALSTSFVTS